MLDWVVYTAVTIVMALFAIDSSRHVPSVPFVSIHAHEITIREMPIPRWPLKNAVMLINASRAKFILSTHTKN